jgi:acyl dehydratase
VKGGDELGPSSWVEVTQARIDAFAEATGDHQSIHVDPGLAARGPFGTTVAHGFLTLSLLPAAVFELVRGDGRVALNYGLNRVRFPAPVPSGSRVRASIRVQCVEPVPGGQQVTFAATVEREGGDKLPAGSAARSSRGSRPKGGRCTASTLPTQS